MEKKKKKESLGKKGRQRDREEEHERQTRSGGGGWENALAGCNRLQAVPGPQLASNLAASTLPPGPQVTHDQQQKQQTFHVHTWKRTCEFQHIHVPLLFFFENSRWIDKRILLKGYRKRFSFFRRALVFFLWPAYWQGVFFEWLKFYSNHSSDSFKSL